MVKVVPISMKVGKHCTHCDKPSVFELHLCNPKIIQQSVTACLCGKCMSRLKKELGTTPNSAMDAIARKLLEDSLERIIHDDTDMGEYNETCECVRCRIQRFLGEQQHQ